MMKFPKFEQVKILKANINYTEIILFDNKTIISGYTLKLVLERHYKSFVRVNRSIAINPTIIQDKTNTTITFDNQTLNIPRRKQ